MLNLFHKQVVMLQIDNIYSLSLSLSLSLSRSIDRSIILKLENAMQLEGEQNVVLHQYGTVQSFLIHAVHCMFDYLSLMIKFMVVYVII